MRDDMRWHVVKTLKQKKTKTKKTMGDKKEKKEKKEKKDKKDRESVGGTVVMATSADDHSGDFIQPEKSAPRIDTSK